jgi:hypothetical protein
MSLEVEASRGCAKNEAIKIPWHEHFLVLPKPERRSPIKDYSKLAVPDSSLSQPSLRTQNFCGSFVDGNPDRPPRTGSNLRFSG